MDVQTVTGPVAADELGVTLIHEHLLFDGTAHYRRQSEAARAAGLRRPAYADGPLRMEALGWARKFGYEHQDNAARTDVAEATREAGYFRDAGGRTIVDVTPIELGRDPVKLRAIAEQSGLNVVMGCGYYVASLHPPELAGRSVEDIYDELVRDVTVGVGDTGVRAGIIGEIGTGDPVTPVEERVLRAAARAQATTGMALSIHTPVSGRHAPRLIELARAEGADPRRIIICHVDMNRRVPTEYLLEVATAGAYLGFDTFGHFEYIVYNRDLARPGGGATDWDRVERIAAVVEAGHADRVVLAQDVCFKTHLKAYGGFGFDHVLESVVPMLRRAGVAEGTVRDMLVANPRRVLSGA